MRATLLLTLLLLGRLGPVDPSDDDDSAPVSLIEEGTVDLGDHRPANHDRVTLKTAQGRCRGR